MVKSIKKAFTLAEVLTTLMVIGVVAAMTIPTLLNSTDDQQKKVAFKKAMSVLSQGTQLMVAKEAECIVKDSNTLADCFRTNILAGTIYAKGDKANDTSYYGVKAAADGVGDNIVTSDGMVYHFVYGGTKWSVGKSLDDICGKMTDLGTTDNDWNGSNANCVVIVDVNGQSKGTHGFHKDYQKGATVAKVQFTKDTMGSDQFGLILTGQGVRPVYVKDGGDVNKGYEYMYGSTESPITNS